MKLTFDLVGLLATTAVVVGGSATASLTSTTSAAQTKLLQNARRVQNNQYGGGYGGQYGGRQGGYYGGYGGGGGAGGGGGGEEAMRENWWLGDYSIKLVSCMAGEQSINYEKGQVESSTVIFRLCPINSCSDNSALGCSEGYADYAVGINTFAEAYVESIRDNYSMQQQQYYQYGYEFKVEEYVRECREMEGGGGKAVVVMASTTTTVVTLDRHVLLMEPISVLLPSRIQ